MIRISSNLVMAYSDNLHVVTHRRSEEVGYFSTNASHMPESHRSYLLDTTEKVTMRAKTIGVSCKTVIAAVLTLRGPRKRTQVSQGDPSLRWDLLRRRTRGSLCHHS